MLQHANSADLVTSLPTAEQVLSDHAPALGDDLVAYRNHVYRVANLCLAIVGDRYVDLEKIAVSAVFHDLGIWTKNTFDYLDPSAALAREYLKSRGRTDWIPEIEATIFNHHKVTSTHTQPSLLVESFRRADWIDVTRGLRGFGVPRQFIAAVFTAWPDAGFHRRLAELTVDQFLKHPLSPLPMVRW